METAIWYWTGSETNVGERMTFELTGSGISSNAVIRRVTYEVDLQAPKYSSSWSWKLKYVRVIDGPSMEDDVSQRMTDTHDTVYCEDTLDTKVYDVYKTSNLTVDIWAVCSYDMTTSVRGVRVIVDYDVPGVTISDFSVTQSGSKYLFSLDANVVAVENVQYDIYRFLSDGQLGRELDTLVSDSGTLSVLSKIPRADYGNTVSFYISVSWNYNDEVSRTGISSNPITPEFIPIYVRYYKDGVGHDCSVNYYDGEKKEWLECEVNYYDGEKWVECSTI